MVDSLIDTTAYSPPSLEKRPQNKTVVTETVVDSARSQEVHNEFKHRKDVELLAAHGMRDIRAAAIIALTGKLLPGDIGPKFFKEIYGESTPTSPYLGYDIRFSAMGVNPNYSIVKHDRRISEPLPPDNASLFLTLRVSDLVQGDRFDAYKKERMQLYNAGLSEDLTKASAEDIPIPDWIAQEDTPRLQARINEHKLMSVEYIQLLDFFRKLYNPTQLSQSSFGEIPTPSDTLIDIHSGGIRMCMPEAYRKVFLNELNDCYNRIQQKKIAGYFSKFWGNKKESGIDPDWLKLSKRKDAIKKALNSVVFYPNWMQNGSTVLQYFSLSENTLFKEDESPSFVKFRESPMKPPRSEAVKLEIKPLDRSTIDTRSAENSIIDQTVTKISGFMNLITPRSCFIKANDKNASEVFKRYKEVIPKDTTAIHIRFDENHDTLDYLVQQLRETQPADTYFEPNLEYATASQIRDYFVTLQKPPQTDSPRKYVFILEGIDYIKNRTALNGFLTQLRGIREQNKQNGSKNQFEFLISSNFDLSDLEIEDIGSPLSNSSTKLEIKPDKLLIK